MPKKMDLAQRRGFVTGVSFSLATFDKLAHFCEKIHATRSSVIEAAVKKYLEENFDKVMKLDL